MRDDIAGNSKNQNEQTALEERVDVMMKPADDGDAVAVRRSPAPTSPTTSAPTLPGDLLRSLNRKDPKAPIATSLPASRPAPVARPVPAAPKIVPQANHPAAVLAPDPVDAEAVLAAQATLAKDAFNDAATDKAVEDIVAKEGDIVLDAEDAKARRRSAAGSKPPGKGWKRKLKNFFTNKWTWIGAGIIVVLVFAVPYTRYKIIGLVISRPIVVTLTDSTAGTPVSGATVSVGGHQAKTDANGAVRFSVPLGNDTLKVTKQYYKTYQTKYFVGFGAMQPKAVKLVATGRQIPIVILNKITGAPLAGVEVKVLDTTAKTDSKGRLLLALPASSATDTASLTLSGYNTGTVNINVTPNAASGNTFYLTPIGKIYFLSNLSGTLDVVGSNLDGSDRKTVLAGTGKETTSTTSLLASRDWKYLVLKSSRSGQPGLYLINTTTGKTTEFDNSAATFTLVGWSGHNFVYDTSKSTISQWQGGREMLKSYDADKSQLDLLDTNQASGTSSQYAYQAFGDFDVIDNQIVYTTTWSGYDASGATYDLTGKSDTIRGIQPDGSSKKDYQSFDATKVSYIDSALPKPQEIYYAVHDTTSGVSYYQFQSGTVSASSISASDISKTYPTYVIAPSDQQAFWAQTSGGSSSLYIGDQNGGSAQSLDSLSDYTPYGWYTDNYLIVSEEGSELFVLPSAGLSLGRQPVKITDYDKTSKTAVADGYSYGGL